MKIKTKDDRRRRIQLRQRKRIAGSTERPRLSVFRSNRYLYVQVISDEQGRTLADQGATSGPAAARATWDSGMTAIRTVVVIQRILSSQASHAGE